MKLKFYSQELKRKRNFNIDTVDLIFDTFFLKNYAFVCSLKS